jgi:sterol-4alpha-carboxylate 3-dehydrogenase (decarboxylating)
MSRALVTGGRGFVGLALVDALVERGDTVTVVDMGASPPREGITYLEADIRDEEAMAKACEGQDIVYHSASIVHTKQSREKMIWDVNFGGTESMLAASRSQGVPKFVYVSTASAVYEGRDIENGDETLPYSTISQAHYADSKIAAEKQVLATSGEGGLLTCAIRPHVVFGPGDTRFLPALLKRAKAGRLKFAVGREQKLSDFTYIGNLVDALMAAGDRLEADSPVAGQAYFITNGEPMGFWDFVRQMLAALDLPPIKGTVPFRVAYAVAAVAEGFDTLRGGTLNSEDGLTRFAVRYMCTHHYFSIDKARRDLGYDPKIDIAAGIALTAKHLRESGLI